MAVRKYYSLVIALMLLLVLNSSIQARPELEEFELVAENEFLELYLNDTLVEFGILDKESGDLWFTNPYDRESKETIAGGASKSRLNSQITLSYFVSNTQNQMDSYNDSVAHGQYEITSIPNGVRVDYRLGRQWQDSDYLPKIMSEAALNEVLEQLPARDRRFIGDMYALFELEEGYVDSDEISIHGVDLDELLGDYGFKVGERNFRQSDKRRLLQEYLNGVMEGMHYQAIRDITHEDIQAIIDTPTVLLKWNLRQWDIEDGTQAFQDIGYTPQDVIAHHEAYNFMPPYENIRTFDMAVEYVLDGPDFLVRVVGDSIKYPRDVWNPQTLENVSYPLSTISLLGYFGAADIDSEGYILVPDGSGALITFNSRRNNVLQYNRNVYGRDLAAAPVTEYSTALDTAAHLPVFGLKNEDSAFLAIIEEGDAMARIEALVSGMRDSFNRVWPTFNYIPRQRVNLEAEGALIGLRDLAINMYQSRPYQGNMTVRYTFLTGEEATYAGMASRYQDYLVERVGLARITPSDTLPLMIDFVGSIDRIEPVLGVPTNVVQPLTTYDQARNIVEDLMQLGADNLRVRYSGWLKGGINHVYPTQAKLERKVGNQRELEEFNSFLSRNNIPLYPDVSFTEVRRDSLTNGFIGFRHASRFLSRRQAYINTHNIATYQPITERQSPLISPNQYKSLVEKFIADYRKYNINGLSIADLGMRLYSDFRVNVRNLIDREEAKDIIVAQASYLHNSGLSLMADGAHVYMLPYLKHISKMPIYSRGVEIVEESVPFYQMVVSGFIEYSAPPANLADQGARRHLLKLLETGSIPAYTISEVTSAEVKHTNFNHLYAINYEDLKPDIILLYSEVNEVLSSLWHQRITDHRSLADDVFLTEYEDGTRVIVNYTEFDILIDDVVVPEEWYVVLQ